MRLTQQLVTIPTLSPPVGRTGEKIGTQGRTESDRSVSMPEKSTTTIAAPDGALKPEGHGLATRHPI